MEDRGDILIKFLVVVAVVLFLVLGGLLFYKYSGLNYYVRVVSLINKMPIEEDRTKVWNDFAVNTTGQSYAGIYAGYLGSKVWIWGERGLRGFAVDQYSVYTFIDGCSEEAFKIIEKNTEGNLSFKRSISFDIESWLAKVKTGDYVIMILAQDGNVGHLREIVARDFYPFIQQNPREQCVK